MRSRRKENDAPCCPICQLPFPSVRNVDPLEHEKKVLRHITRCNAKSSGVARPSSTKQEASSPPPIDDPCSLETLASRKTHSTANTTKETLFSCKSQARFAVSPSITSEEDHSDRLCSQTVESTETVDHRRGSYMTPEEDSRGPKKLSMDDFSLPVARELSSPAGESDMKVLYPEKEAKARMEDRQWVPSHSDEDRKLTPQELQKETHPSIEAMHCPICLELFPRQQQYFSEEDYERKILDHVLKCSSRADVRTPPFKPKTVATKGKRKEKSEMVVRKRSIVDWVDGESGSKTSGAGTPASSKRENGGDELMAKRRLIISDPGHFLNQTWWRTKKNVKRCVPAVVFSLQQCVVLDNNYEGDTYNQKSAPTRESQRIQARTGRQGRLKLRCPICGQLFNSTYLGEITEESISRHVTKCTQNMFDSGVNIPVLASNTRKDCLDQANRACGTQNRKLGLIVRRPPLSDDEKRMKRAAVNKRAASLRRVTIGQPKRSFDELLFKSHF